MAQEREKQENIGDLEAKQVTTWELARGRVQKFEEEKISTAHSLGQHSQLFTTRLLSGPFLSRSDSYDYGALHLAVR